MIDPESYYLALKKDDTMHFAAMRDDDQLRHYEEGIYIPFGAAAIREKIMQMTHGAGVSKHRVGEIVALMTWDNYVERGDFDADPDIINMDNGLYSIQTGLSPHTPKYLSRHKSPIKYDPEAKCPNIDNFISEVVPPEYVQTIYEIGGYALSPRKRLKRAFIFVGEPNSGKSKLLELLKHLVGGRATTNVSPITVSNTTFGSAQYYDKLLNIVDDLGNTPIRDTGILKSVIGGGSIEGQFKNGQPFDFTPNVLCVFATNQVPEVEPFDDAFASRFDIIPFTNQFEGTDADPDLIDKLTTPEEMSGFFNKCMKALKVLMGYQTFSNESTIADRVRAYKYRSSPVEQFLDEVCRFDDPNAYVFKQTLMIALEEWAEQNHVMTPSMGKLTVALRDGKKCPQQLATNDQGVRKGAYFGVDFKHDLTDYT